MKVRKMMNKLLAATLSATMVAGMTMTAFASTTNNTASGTIDIPVYNYDVTNVIVPSTYAVAFNPDQLSVQPVSGATAVSGQIVSRNFGIVNKSSKDKVVTVELSVQDQTSGKIQLVESVSGHNSRDDYAIKLQVVPADTTEVKVVTSGVAGVESITKDTLAERLGNVEMTKATSGVVLDAGSNKIAFKLAAAQISGDFVLGESGNTYGITEVAADGKGATAFTFDGEMNAKADWTKAAGGVKITVKYTWETAEGDESIASGTGAMIVDNAPQFTTGGVGVINIAAGADGTTVASIKKVTAPWNNAPYDLTANVVLSDDKATITISNGLSGWNKNKINPVATITYVDSNNKEKTATVILKTY